MKILLPILILGGLGLFFGLLLAFASKIFNVDKDEKLEQILSALPGVNCGGCGYAGCSGFADAVYSGIAPITGCPVGKSVVSDKIAKILGLTNQEQVEMVAKVFCGGNCESAIHKYMYEGIDDCFAANKLGGGSKVCSFGCLGLGSCVKVCKFGAISIVNGISVIDSDKCVCCGECLKKCPKKIIGLTPKKQTMVVLCKNNDKGAVAKDLCNVSCIGCKMCQKVCPCDAIIVENNLARIDANKCINCGKCAEKCPRKCIVNS